MKFLVDQMFGTLAKWIRLFGFDVFYTNQEMTDDELLHIAKEEERILFSRDKELCNRAKKKEIQALYVASKKLNEQLQIIFHSYPNMIKEIHPFSRCSVCNTPINPIEKKQIRTLVPLRIFENHTHFWHCSTCHRIYWKGTHYQKILATIKQFKKRYDSNLL